MTKQRYTLRETAQVDLPDGTHVGVIEATEPGGNLRDPIEGTAYHVRLPGHDSLRSRVVIVGEDSLRKLVDD